MVELETEGNPVIRPDAIDCSSRVPDSLEFPFAQKNIKGGRELEFCYFRPPKAADFFSHFFPKP